VPHPAVQFGRCCFHLHTPILSFVLSASPHCITPAVSVDSATLACCSCDSPARERIADHRFNIPLSWTLTNKPSHRHRHAQSHSIYNHSCPKELHRAHLVFGPSTVDGRWPLLAERLSTRENGLQQSTPSFHNDEPFWIHTAARELAICTSLNSNSFECSSYRLYQWPTSSART
jgi:hypothetical protein